MKTNIKVENKRAYIWVEWDHQLSSKSKYNKHQKQVHPIVMQDYKCVKWYNKEFAS